MIDAGKVRALLLDIEGTTTPISFVYDTLFPYAATHLEKYLSDHFRDDDVKAEIEALRAQREADLKSGMTLPPGNDDSEGQEIESLTVYARWLMSRDSKFSALKALQGKIWEEGYRRGGLSAEVFDDVPRALGRWRARGLKVYIYSSGSVLAQRLLFGNSTQGDLTQMLDGFYDTAMGAKTNPESYVRITERIGVEPIGILFLSDAPRELDAARQAGVQTALCIRPGNQPVAAGDYSQIQSFDDLPL